MTVPGVDSDGASAQLEARLDDFDGVAPGRDAEGRDVAHVRLGGVERVQRHVRVGHKQADETQARVHLLRVHRLPAGQ